MAAGVSGPENFEMDARVEELAALIARILDKVEAHVGAPLEPRAVSERGKQALTVLVHELLHAGIDRSLSELSDPSDPVADLAQEILVRILETQICQELGLPSHTAEEHAREMAQTFPHLPLTAEDYAELLRAWPERLRKNEDLEACSRDLLTLVAARIHRPQGRAYVG